jgi:hypothetical protein
MTGKSSFFLGWIEENVTERLFRCASPPRSAGKKGRQIFVKAGAEEKEIGGVPIGSCEGSAHEPSSSALRLRKTKAKIEPWRPTRMVVHTVAIVHPGLWKGLEVQEFLARAFRPRFTCSQSKSNEAGDSVMLNYRVRACNNQVSEVLRLVSDALGNEQHLRATNGF